MTTARIVSALVILMAGSASAYAEQNCEAVKALSLPDTTIELAETHAAGTAEFKVNGPPGLRVSQPSMKAALPAYCRVTGHIRPTSDSDIRFELWMPLDNWNHRYQQIGNGGLAGMIQVTSLITPLQQGWAVAGTDDGHIGESMADGRWALGHPEKVIDYGYRAVHLTAERAKAIVRAFYRAESMRSYFVGCSDGGRESMMEAQRYPDDFDGFVAGAPALDIPSLAVGSLYRERAALELAKEPLSARQTQLVADKALQQCDALDGVKDGVIENPRACNFKPQSLLCKQGQAADSCLSAAQLRAVQDVYEGLRDAKTGKALSYGYQDTIGTPPAGLTPNDAGAALGHQLFANMVYNDAQLDVAKLDLLKASADAHRLDPILNPTSTNLAAVKRSGKKIIQYHGWADTSIPAESSLAYFESVQQALGDTSNFYRLFMVPGMGHCGGGVGPAWIMGNAVAHDAEHDAVVALTRWVEQGVAPDQIIATEFANAGSNPMEGPDPGTPVKSTRPICAYPKQAAYKGSGDTNNAANFECRATGKSKR